MEITVISEEENPMLHRTDVQFRVSHAEATPDRLAVRDSLAARLNKNADEVVIRQLDTKFGMRETVGEAKVYQGAEFATDVEQAHMLARNKIGEAAEADEEEAEAEEEAPESEESAEAEPEDEAPEESAEVDPEEAPGPEAGEEETNGEAAEATEEEPDAGEAEETESAEEEPVEEPASEGADDESTDEETEE